LVLLRSKEPAQQRLHAENSKQVIAAAHPEDSKLAHRKGKTRSALTLLIHHVQILKPQSTVVNRRLRSSILPFAVGMVAFKGMDRLSTF
jgi:hypothetical protein